MTLNNQEWLNQVIEEPIDPGRQICDPHHHLFICRPNTEANYFQSKFASEISNSGHNIVSTIYIECKAMYRNDGPDEMKPVGEVEFANGQAAMAASGLYGETKICAGIIGYADLRLGAAVGEVLDAELAAARDRFRGIRFAGTWNPDPKIRNGSNNPTDNQFQETLFREGFDELRRRNLVFEAWCYHTHLKKVTDLARAFPDITIILNHFGGPIGVGSFADKRDEVFAQWQIDISELATCENVYAKLGGLQMDVNGFEWHKRVMPPSSRELMEATRPWHYHTIDAFGTNRCMFESNFPVDKFSCSYGVLWNSFKRLTEKFSTSEKAKLFHDNAVKLYSL